MNQTTDASQPDIPMPVSTLLPTHIAIIMDGNGRWAAEKGLQRTEGHRAGTETARRTVEECRSIGIRYLTLYTFSKENWSRPAEEVRFLFELLSAFITKELPSLIRQEIRLNVLGDMSSLPFAARKVLEHACAKTAKFTQMTLNLALNYSGREEIARACRLFMEQGGTPENLTPEALASYLYTAGQPDPDLIIRTSGEVRISNFLLFQAAYSEFFFTETLWPDFTPIHLTQAINAFASRSRRFGGLETA